MEKNDIFNTNLLQLPLKAQVADEGVVQDIAPVAEPTAPAMGEGLVLDMLAQDGGVLRRLSNVTPKKCEKLASGFLHRGEITLLCGDGGVGKGQFVAQIAKSLTTGEATEFFPQAPEGTGNIVILAGEDPIDTVLCPRMDAAGADLNKVAVITPDTYCEEMHKMPQLGDPDLMNWIAAGDPLLPVIDPFQAFLPDMVDNRTRYEGIDGLKAYAIIGIALMHVLANGEYRMGGFVFERFIPSFINLVFLFMMVSGFGMCCGYYQKIIDQKISVEDFYKKRYIKIWPYFALLCALDFMMSPSKESVFEVFANLTLCQGLLPNAKISVIGVSWTLAVIFVFYMLFPFFCFLIGNKKRAWSVAVVALVFNWLCSNYFNAGRTNIVYDAIYFVAGGLVFLYRKELAEFASKYKVIAGAILLIATVVYFAVGGNALTMLFFCVAALVYTLGCRTGGGYWSIQSPSSSVVSASRFTCVTW